MTTDDSFSQPTTAELVDDPDAGPAPVDFTQPDGADAGSEWEETGGRRKMPHPETGKLQWFTRASKIGGWVAEQFTLTEWKIANAVAGVAHNRDLYALANAEPIPAIEDRAKGWWMPWAKIGHQGMDRIGASSGAHEGTAVHRFRERVDAGTLKVEDVPEEWRPHVEASERRRVALGLEIVHAEAFICNTKVHNGASGRLDNLLRGPDGRLVIEDLKTGKNVPMGLDEIAIQLAIYANAEWLYDVDAKVWLPMPNVRKDVAIVTWVPIDRPDEAETIVVDIAWGWAAAQVAGWVQGYRNRGKRKGDGLRLPLEALAEPERAPDPATLLPGYREPIAAFPGAPAVMTFAGPVVVPELDEATEDRIAAEFTAETPCAADGSPLQPLADRAAGERGCSDCGRKGHRKGSPKCWGPVTDDVVGADADDTSEQPNMFEDQRPDAVPEADEDHWVDGPSEMAPSHEDPAGHDDVEQDTDDPATFCICTSRRAGWTRNPETDAWVCGSCGLPSRAALMHEAAGRPARPAELSAFTAAEAQEVLDAKRAAVMPVVSQVVDAVIEGVQSGADELARRKRIEAASTLADLGAIYMELYPAGLWTAELDALGNRRKAEIKGEAPALRSV